MVNLPRVRNLTIPALRRGSRVAVVSPASYPQPERLAQGNEALSRLGFVPAVGRHALAKAHHYFAGTAQARLEDLHAAFLDTNAGAIFLGHETPVAVGDYAAGPSHVLPTGGDQVPPGLGQFRYRGRNKVSSSIERSYAASARYLAQVAGGR